MFGFVYVLDSDTMDVLLCLRMLTDRSVYSRYHNLSNRDNYAIISVVCALATSIFASLIISSLSFFNIQSRILRLESEIWTRLASKCRHCSVCAGVFVTLWVCVSVAQLLWMPLHVCLCDRLSSGDMRSARLWHGSLSASIRISSQPPTPTLHFHSSSSTPPQLLSYSKSLWRYNLWHFFSHSHQKGTHPSFTSSFNHMHFFHFYLSLATNKQMSSRPTRQHDIAWQMLHWTYDKKWP